MSELPTINQLQQMTDTEVADLNRKMAKRALRNMLILFGVKYAIIYSINRWARSLDQKN
jgi:hypothetical protein